MDKSFKNITLILMLIGLISVAVQTYQHYNRPPPPPVIITVPSLPDAARTEIDKDIMFEKAFKQFSECMEDANKTKAEECKAQFWAYPSTH